MSGVTKFFGSFMANQGVDLRVAEHSIHGLLGENGAGKSTLMRILNGATRADDGVVEVFGRPVELRSTADARAAGIGMVHQHFSLVDQFSVADNLALVDGGHRGWARIGRPVDSRRILAKGRRIAERLGFPLEERALCGDLGVGARQRLEIIKALWDDTRILILDEPTASLSPQEAEDLHETITALRSSGTTVILISHKLPEIIEMCDEVTVLRDGRVAARLTVDLRARESVASRRSLERDLVRAMIGREPPESPGRASAPGAPLLQLEEVVPWAGRGPFNLEVREGEIVGVAGVEGNGQSELIEVILGVRRIRSGRVWLAGTDLTHVRTRARLGAGIAHVAEDRHKAGIAPRLNVVTNAALGFPGRGGIGNWRWLSQKALDEHALRIVTRMGIKIPGLRVNVDGLSGGNQQRLVIGRELARRPTIMVAGQPTRGLDIGAAAQVLRELASLREGGAGVLLVSHDLQELLQISDRLVVMYKGTIVAEYAAGEIDVETVGLAMTGGASDAPDVRATA